MAVSIESPDGEGQDDGTCSPKPLCARAFDSEGTSDSATRRRNARTSVVFPQFPLVRLDLDDDGSDEEVVAEVAEGANQSEKAAGRPRADYTRSPSVGGPKSPRRRQQEQRRAASAQRQRHDALVRDWMPTQRGANMTLATRIGSQTVEGWFKRTFVRAARMLHRIHTFPTQDISPEALARIEAEVLAAIGGAVTNLAKRQTQCAEMLHRVGAQQAFYSRHFEMEVVVSTKTALELHALYHRADELMLLVESLDFAGLLSEGQRGKLIGAMHATIFGLAKSIERLHRGLYVRIAKGTGASVADPGEERP